ncbi:MAG: TonB-dependent receptor [Proteobacteria bacterium]|nr:TonB-dependent receptor [Pseudomonadota bacterium]
MSVFSNVPVLGQRARTVADVPGLGRIRRCNPVAHHGRRAVVGCIVTLCLLSAQVRAQSAASSGSVKGVVTSEGGGVLEGVWVKLLQVDGQETGYEAFSNRQGRYFLGGIPPGSYTLKLMHIGAKTVRRSIEVRPGASTSVSVQLSLARSDTPDDEWGEVVVVTGTARSKAIMMEVAAIGKKNVLSADKAGRSPDVNAAEGAGRLPGVYVDNDRGEGRFASVRGAPSSFNRVKLDGASLGSPESDGLSVPLDVFPLAQLAQIEVSKSILPNQDANSVGGEINLRTPTAFGRDGPATSVSVYGGYHELSDRFRGRVTSAHSTIFGGRDQFGVQLYGSFNRKELSAETVEASDWDRTDEIPGFEAAEPFVIDDLELRNMDVRRDRMGGGTVLEWKPTQSARIYASGSFNRFVETEYRDRFVLQLDDGGDIDSTRDITVAPASDEDGIPTVTRATFTGLSDIEREWQRDYTPQNFWVASTGAEIDLDQWLFDVAATLSRTSEKRIRDVVEFGLAPGSAVAFDATGESYLPRFEHLSGPDPFAAGDYTLTRLRIRKNFRFDNVVTASANGSRRSTLLGNELVISTGARVTIRRRKVDEGDDIFTEGASPIGLADRRFERAEANSSLVDGTYNYGPSVDRDGVGVLFDERDDLLEFDQEETTISYSEDDYQASERVYAGYAQTQYRIRGFSALGGVRVEHTDFDISSFAQLAGADEVTFEEDKRESSYTNVFPGVHLRYAVTENLILRASWSNTIGRPSFNELRPSPNVDLEDQEISQGNPDLEPFRSANYDASVDWYSDRFGNIGVAGFYKRINGFLRDVEEEITDGRFAGFTLSTVENADLGTLLGGEVVYNKQLKELPGPLSGLGIDLNATLVRSEVETPEREGEGIPLDGQATFSGNVALSYNRGPVFAQITYGFIGPLFSFEVAEGEDQYEDWNNRLGIKASYNLTRHASLAFSARNLTDQHLRRYRGNTQRIRENEQNSWWAELGVQAKF